MKLYNEKELIAVTKKKKTLQKLQKYSTAICWQPFRHLIL
jgi:hypothetical protein